MGILRNISQNSQCVKFSRVERKLSISVLEASSKVVESSNILPTGICSECSFHFVLQLVISSRKLAISYFHRSLIIKSDHVQPFTPLKKIYILEKIFSEFSVNVQTR